MPAVKKLLRAIWFILFVSCVSIVLLEAAGRFFLPSSYYAFPREYFRKSRFYGYELSPSFRGTYAQPEFSISIDTNSLGMRDVQHDLTAAYKILSLGDSVAFGIGVDLPDTYLSILENKLNARHGWKRTAVIKAGIPGYSTFNEKVYLEKKGLIFAPSLVMVQFWWDDLGVDHLTYQAEAGFLSSGRMPALPALRAFLNSHSRSYVLLRRFFYAVFHKPLFGASPAGPEGDLEQLKARFAATVQQFREIEEACRRQQAQCLFVLIPSREFVYGSSKQRDLWKMWVAYVKRQGIAFVDLEPALEKAAQEKQLFFAIDPHLTGAGHKVVAESLWERLKESGELQ